MLYNDDFRNHLHLFNQDVYVISDPPYNQKYHYGEYRDDMEVQDIFNNHYDLICEQAGM